MTRARRVLRAGMAAVLAGRAGVGGDADEAEGTYLESFAMFNECVVAEELPEASVEEFHVGGVEGMTIAADRATVEACLESSGYGAFVSSDGVVTHDEDFLNRANTVARSMKRCLEERGWPQDELAFDEQGLLMPMGEGPTLDDSEASRYVDDSETCHEEAVRLVRP